MSQTKIIVLKRRQLLLWSAAALIVVLLLILLLVTAQSKPKEVPQNGSLTGRYIPGQYTKDLELGASRFRLTLHVDSTQVKSCEVTLLDESVSAMYPLIPDAASHLSDQLSAGLSPSELTLSETSRYTELYLLGHIEALLQKAARNAQ